MVCQGQEELRVVCQGQDELRVVCQGQEKMRVVCQGQGGEETTDSAGPQRQLCCKRDGE